MISLLGGETINNPIFCLFKVTKIQFWKRFYILLMLVIVHCTHEHTNYYHISGCCYDPRGDPRPGHPSPETLPPGPGILSQYQEESSLSHVNYFAGVSRKFLNIIISTMYNTLCATLLYMFNV